jgi:hypothetical protein
MFNDIDNYKCSSNRQGNNRHKPYHIATLDNHMVLYHYGNKKVTRVLIVNIPYKNHHKLS